MSTSRPVLLFKDPTADLNYEKTLESKGYTAKCIPVLHTIHTNIAELVEGLSKAKQLQIQGMLVTSKRSCESLGEALTRLCYGSGDSVAGALAYLSTIPFYVVGEATATAVRGIQGRFKDSGFASVMVRGEHSGTGEQLGKFIVEHHKRTGDGTLLYLIGDKNRDTVPSILAENSIPFWRLQVYETRQRPDFESLLEETVYSFPYDATANPWWVVCFAPSTAKFAIPSAQKLFSSRNISSRIATIGPVTTSSIEKVNGSVVQVTAAKPEPLSLAEAMRIYDDRLGSDELSSTSKELRVVKRTTSADILVGRYVSVKLRYSDGTTGATHILFSMPSAKTLDPALDDGCPTDIVIPIMGPTGAGKSSFINLLLKQISDRRVVKVGTQLASCTSDLESVVIKDQIESQDAHFLYLDNEYRIVLIDTPGFDDTLSSDYEILKQITKWLLESFRRKMILGGVIYLHDISQDRFSSTARRVLGMLRNMCSEVGLDKVVLGTTKWSREGSRNFGTRERELMDVYWNDMLPPQDAASVMRLSHRTKNEAESAWRVVRHILRRLDGRLLKKAVDEVVQRQDKRTKKRSTPAETEAARGLRIRMQTALDIHEEIVALEGQGVEGYHDETIRGKEQKLREMHQAISTAWKEKPSRARRMVSSFLRPTQGPAVDDEGPTPPSKLEPGDMVLLVAGVTGSGRTTFINALLREVGVKEMEVGHSGSLSACTTEVQCAMIDLTQSSICKKDYRLFVVDTPGFNDCDPKRSDSHVLQAILNWVHEWMQPAASCRGGILYLQDISVYPLPPLASVNRTALSKNLDSDFFKQLAFATTKWKYSEDFGETSHSTFERQLGPIVSAGSKVYKFKEDLDAWSILQDFLPRIEQGREVALGGVLEAIKRGASQRPHLGGMDSFLNRFFGLLERLFV